MASRIESYIYPTFADHYIDQIGYADLSRWLDSLSAKGLSRTTVRYAHSLLRRIITEARLEQELPPLPRFPALPATDRKGVKQLDWDDLEAEEDVALTKDQLAVFLRASQAASPDGWHPMCILGFGSGARFSELAAAQAQDFDLSGDVGIWLNRRHAIQATQEIKQGRKWDPKGTAVYLDPETTRLLRPYLAGLAPTDLVFGSEADLRKPRTNVGMNYFLEITAKAAGLPKLTSKVFRRTYATLTAVSSMQSALKDAQAQLGHTDPKTTAVYVRPSVGHRKAAAQGLGAVLHAVPSDAPASRT